MFKIDEIIVHPNAGICKIGDIRFERFGMSNEKYYVLSPVYSSAPTKIYVPVFGNKIELRYPLSKEQLLSAIENSASIEERWIDNDKQRNEIYNNVLKSKEPTAIIEILCELHKKRKERAAVGKKLRSNDERIISEAEKLIHTEFAYVLGITPDSVPKYIMQKLGIEE